MVLDVEIHNDSLKFSMGNVLKYFELIFENSTFFHKKKNK